MAASALLSSTNSDRPILIVDNDPDRRLRNALSGIYYLGEASTAAAGLVQVEGLRPALILTELDLPDMDGIEMIGRIRSMKHKGPIIVVSARFKNQNSIIDALDAGADAFVPKPFSKAELHARVRVALRQAALNQEEIRHEAFRAGELEVDLVRRRVRVSGRDVHLTPLEYRMLCLLIVNADRVLSYNHVLQEVWKSKKNRHKHYVHLYMAALRRKLEPDPSKPRHLVTEFGVGYQFHL